MEAYKRESSSDEQSDSEFDQSWRPEDEEIKLYDESLEERKFDARKSANLRLIG